LESRILQGYVALDRGRICGYTFCVYEGHKAVIGDAFALRHGEPDPETTRLLLSHALEMLRHSPAVDRVESQLLLFDSGEFKDVFTGPRFSVHPRLFLECNLGPRHETDLDSTDSDFELSPWIPQDYQPAAELIHACYTGHTDSLINDQYRTLHGSLRFLHNIVRFPGCGIFEPHFSWVLRERSTRTLIGMLLTSRVAEHVAHVTQLCILPAQRGRGLGRLLLKRTAQSLAAAHLDAVTLTVTESNRQAVKLYERFGFTTRHRFDAMVFDPKLQR
jgi:GNAT superfamily N-acetyltransferase